MACRTVFRSLQHSKQIYRCLSLSAANRADMNTVTVIGSGLMGSGIAQVSAHSGYQVYLVDISDEILSKSRSNIQKSLNRVAKKAVSDGQEQEAYVSNIMNRMQLTTDLKSAASKAGIIVEAATENIDLKRKLFAQVEETASKDAVLATNTSSLLLSDVSKNLQRRENFGGLHFFNPVPIMKLVEVVRMPETSDEAFNILLEFGKKVGKTTISCKDKPGFVVNRLLVPYMAEALRMAERGDASTKDIDTAMKLGAGYPMGPFELTDYVGLDTTKFIIDGWHDKFPEEPLFKPSPLLDRLVAEGKLGRKTGEGFYKY